MKTTVRKWGNSLAVRIPKAAAVETNLAQGSVVEVEVRNGRIVLEPQRPPKYTLEELVAGMTEENRHDEIDSGPPVGKELW